MTKYKKVEIVKGRAGTYYAAVPFGDPEYALDCLKKIKEALKFDGEVLELVE